jgi:probable rRNA maturation factor
MSKILLDLQIASETKNLPSAEQLKTWAELACHKTDETELTIRLVDAEESQALNLQYRGKDKPTNVLSFPFEMPEHIELNLLGDLVICAPVVELEASQQGKPTMDHWAHLTIHGVLHLQGYDHIEEEEAVLMESLETELLGSIGIKDPYTSI